MVSTLIDSYPDLVVVEYHFLDAYRTDWGDARADLYDVIIPWLGYDGLFDAGSFDHYEPALQARLAESTDVTVNLTGVEQAADTWQFTAEVCVEPGGVGKTMRVYMVEALDNYPESPTYSRNTFRQAADTGDVTVAAGECAQVTRSLTFDATSMAQPEDIRVMAWAQEPLDGIPALVHQATQTTWPFPGAALFADGFESGDSSGWSAVQP